VLRSSYYYVLRFFLRGVRVEGSRSKWFVPEGGYTGAGCGQTRESPKPRPLELRFRATLGADQEVEVTLV
jgi:hypothetical protein